jgi:hypothetical protein
MRIARSGTGVKIFSAAVVDAYRQLWCASAARVLIQVAEERFDRDFWCDNQLGRPTTRLGRVCKFILQRDFLEEFAPTILDALRELAECLGKMSIGDFRRMYDGDRHFEEWSTEFLVEYDGRCRLEALCSRILTEDDSDDDFDDSNGENVSDDDASRYSSDEGDMIPIVRRALATVN